MEQRWSVRFDDLQQVLLDVDPDVVHFSGINLEGEAGVLLEDDRGRADPMDAETFLGVLRLCKARVGCVVLNTCSSRSLAEAILPSVGCAIAMPGEVSDQDCATFARGFYRALATGRSFASAHQAGCNEMRQRGVAPDQMPIFVVSQVPAGEAKD